MRLALFAPAALFCRPCVQRKRSSRLSARVARRGTYGEEYLFGGSGYSSRRSSSGTEAAAAAASGPLIEGVPAEALLQVG